MPSLRGRDAFPAGTGLGGAIEKIGEDCVSGAPMGRIKIRMAESDFFGILDQDVGSPPGEGVLNPMRAQTARQKSYDCGGTPRAAGFGRTGAAFSIDDHKGRTIMGMLKEFKEFAVKGNVLDMAVGVIIGTGFGKVAASFLNDVLMPPLGLIIGGMDFKNLAVVMKEAAPDVKPVTLNYGAFITNTIDFFLLAFAVFLLVKGVNRLKRQTPAPPPAPSEKSCGECLMNIPIKARRCGHCGQPVAA